MNNLEIELKAGLVAKDAGDLVRVLGAQAGPGSAALVLHAIYFDSADRRLEAAGIGFRVRREGRRLVQTVKTGRTSLGGFHQVHETDVRLKTMQPDVAAIPDAALRARIEKLLGGSALAPIFETRVSRRRWTVGHSHGLVDVALDRGEIRSGLHTKAVLEAEFELLGGSPEALFEVAGGLVGGTCASLNLPSKSARGHALALGKPEPARALGRKPRAPARGTDGSFAWSAVLETLAPVIAANLHALFTDDAAEWPHQLRVALRRLRAAVRLHRPLIEPEIADSLEAEARLLGQIVAPLRDADMLAQTVLGHLGRKVDPVLQAALQRHRARVSGDVCAALRAASATGFAVRLLGLAAVGGWRPGGRAEARSIEALAERTLGKLWAKCLSLGDRLSALDDEDRHEFRKSLKKLRYSIELIPVSLDRKSFTSAFKKLQEDLGTLNDISVLEGWDPALDDPIARSLLEEVKVNLVEIARTRGDLALGRACRHWRELRVKPQPWVQARDPLQPRSRSR
ncbi:MAG: CHAD domain-containing protein [Sandaracinobacteroides sp.]